MTGYTKALVDAVDRVSRVSFMFKFNLFMALHFVFLQDVAKNMKAKQGRTIASIGVWPFLPTIFDESPCAAWPHVKGRPFGPLVAEFLWDKTG